MLRIILGRSRTWVRTLHLCNNRSLLAARVTLATLPRVQEADAAAAAEHEEIWTVVGFEVMPCSVKRTFGDAIAPVNCKPWPHDANPEPQRIEEGADIIYSYDVFWDETDTKWASRWDLYLRMPSGSVHWFSILTSLLVVLVMAAIMSVILRRTVRHNLATVKEPALLPAGDQSGEERGVKSPLLLSLGNGEGGGKLQADDVLRPPAHMHALAVQARPSAPSLRSLCCITPSDHSRERSIHCGVVRATCTSASRLSANAL